MAKRLIGFQELDTLDGLVERHLKLQGRLEHQEAEAAQFGLPAEGLRELSRHLHEVRLELALKSSAKS